METTTKYLLGAGVIAAIYYATRNSDKVGATYSGRKVLDKPAIKNVSVANLNYDGRHVGKVVSVYSNSGVLTTGIWVWDGPLKPIDTSRNVATAGGGGYDKLSATVYEILMANGIEPLVVKPGNGETRREFEAHGYEYTELI
jgi:hypothetical protein